MPMSSSAPVTPIASPNQTIEDTLDSSNSTIGSLNSFDPDLSMLSQVSASHTIISLPICTKCSNMEIENSKTKLKLDQLRLVMQQRRERREARKMRSAPYGGRIIGSAATTNTTTTATNSTNPNDGSNTNNVIQAAVEAPPTNSIVEQVNTLA